MERIGRYAIERQLGKGALATVYLGKDDKLPEWLCERNFLGFGRLLP